MRVYLHFDTEGTLHNRVGKNPGINHTREQAVRTSPLPSTHRARYIRNIVSGIESHISSKKQSRDKDPGVHASPGHIHQLCKSSGLPSESLLTTAFSAWPVPSVIIPLLSYLHVYDKICFLRGLVNVLDASPFPDFIIVKSVREHL